MKAHPLFARAAGLYLLFAFGLLVYFLLQGFMSYYYYPADERSVDVSFELDWAYFQLGR